MTFVHRHFHALVFACFWMGLFQYGLIAPPDRVALLESAVVTRGWHLSVLASLLGLPPLLLYVVRMRGGQSLGKRETMS